MAADCEPPVRRLNRRQYAFVAAYAGDACAAAAAAGYGGRPHSLEVQASRLMHHPGVRAALAARASIPAGAVLPIASVPLPANAIATRLERQQWWSSVMRDTSAELPLRLRAAELLGRSEGDFVDRMHHEVGATLEELILESIARREDRGAVEGVARVCP